jgi:hypothetical protein
VKSPTHAGRHAIGPGALDQYATRKRVASLGNSGAPDGASGRVFAGHQAEIGHQLASICEASKVTDFGTAYRMAKAPLGMLCRHIGLFDADNPTIGWNFAFCPRRRPIHSATSRQFLSPFWSTPSRRPSTPATLRDRACYTIVTATTRATPRIVWSAAATGAIDQLGISSSICRVSRSRLDSASSTAWI